MGNVKTKNVLKYSTIITVILIISKVTGLGRELLIAARFGATRESDIYNIASTMPNVLFSAVNAAIVTTFIPVFSGIKNDKEKVDSFFSNILNIVSLLCIVLSVIGIIGAPLLVKLFAVFKGSEFTQTVNMTRIVVPSIFFLGVSGLYTGYLQSYGVFIQPALTGIVANIVIIVGIVFFYKYGLTVIIIFTLAGAVTQMLVQQPFIKNFKYKFFINLKDEHVRTMMKMAIPILITTTASQINLMVDRRFASSFVAGSISVINYANKVSTLINQVFIASLTTVLYPALTEKFSSKNKEEFNGFFVRSINIVLLVVVPLSLEMLVLSTPLVKLLLQHGKFDARSTAITSSCLQILAISAIGYSLIDILGKVFFSMKDTFTPMINGFILIGTNIIGIFIFAPRLGVRGLSLAQVMSTFIAALVMIVELKLRLKTVNIKRLISISLKVVGSAAIGSFAVYVIYYKVMYMIPESFIGLILKITVSGILGLVIYAAFMLLLKVDEFKFVLNVKKKK